MPRIRNVDQLSSVNPEDLVVEAPKKPGTWPELTPEEITLAKEKAFGMPVYKFENSNQTYVFRALASHEWQKLMKDILALDAKESISVQKQNEMICNVSVVWPAITASPDFWDRNLAGIAESLVLQIREKSGFPMTLPDGTPLLDSVKVKKITEETPIQEEPSDEALEEMRKASPNGQIYRAEFPSEGGIHYYRPLMRTEWSAVQTEEQKGKDSQDFAVRSVLLWSSYPWATQPALSGVVEQLFEEVMKCSGFAWTPVIEEL